jgi:anti-anti-sigma factor
MPITQAQQGELLQFHLSGRLDSFQTSALETGLFDDIAGARQVLIDCTELEFISSAGLRVILMAAKRAKQAGGRLALFGLNANIRKVFSVSGFLKILNVFDTQAEARAFVAAS